MTLDEAEASGRKAYLWGWALVNAAKRADRARFVTSNGANVVHVQGTPVGYGQIVMLTGHVGTRERLICCPSGDIIYGSGIFHLSGTQGIVIQVPDFGNRHWLYTLYDARTNEFSRIGRQYQTAPGFHLLVGPNWNGVAPAGIDRVWKCETDLLFALPRVYTNGTLEDLQTIQPLIQQICSYPVEEFDPGTWQTRNWNNYSEFNLGLLLNGRGPEARYVKPEQFLLELRGILGTVFGQVPPRPGEEALYDRFRELLLEATLRPLIRFRLMQTFAQTEADTILPMMQWRENGVTAGNGWYTSVNAAEWGVDEYRARTATAKSNMFENRAEETKYYYTDTDSAGVLLDGSNSYSIQFSPSQLLKAHVKGFWSISVYDEFHFFNTVSNPIGRHSIGTKNEESLVYGDDGSLTLYTGATPPPQGESNWLPTPNGEPFSLYIRAYWPDETILNGAWLPPSIVRTHWQTVV